VKSHHHRLLHFAAPAAALVIGLLAGRSSLPSSNSADPTATAADGLRNSQRPMLASQQSGDPRRSPTRGGSAQSGERPISDILATTDRSSRLRGLLNLLDRLDAKEFPGVLKELEAGGLDLAFRDEYLLVIAEWANRDPLAAVQHVSATNSDREVRDAVMSAWAAADPLAAEQWAREAHPGDGANPWLVGVIGGIARSDIEAARRLIEEFPRGGDRNRALRATLGHVLANGPTEAANWVNALNDDRLQNDGGEWLAEHLAGRDPVAAAAWVSSLNSTEARRDAAEEVAERFARHDLNAAKAWVASLPADTRLNAAAGVVEEMARQNPAAAFAWLAELGSGPELDAARREIVERGFDTNPADALTTALHLSDDRTRERYTSRYLERWFEADPIAASGWLTTHSAWLPDELRTRFVTPAN
jgi:hypothetical protein